ncbi:MAG: aspartate/glutamate racemase family protein [Deltaproteobacteria bacterium]|nr:aspartate/glutamate racemase family protein [Deltaproteobacteria bacterium]
MNHQVLGILGGMGPLASCAFLQTVYEENIKGQLEQNYPNVILHSMSSVPDRTASFKQRAEDAFLEILIANLRSLVNVNVSKIIICCFTSHCLLHHFPDDISDKIVSLVDITARELARQRQPALLLASLGTYQKGLFENAGSCQAIKELIVIPTEPDQHRIHQIIYERLKPGTEVASVYPLVKSLLEKYQVNTFIAGCTEFHLLVRYLIANNIDDIIFIDPLLTIARNLEEIINGCDE